MSAHSQATTEIRKHVYEPKIQSRTDSNNMLLLGHYRNKMVFVFFRESIWAAALRSLGDGAVTSGADKQKLFEVARFLYHLLQREAIDKPDPSQPEVCISILALTFISFVILKVVWHKLGRTSRPVSSLCSLVALSDSMKRVVLKLKARLCFHSFAPCAGLSSIATMSRP